MNVESCMSTEPRIATPHDTIAAAARQMRDIEAGFMPVGENDRMVGMITDRDIAIRAVAEGKGPNTRVGEVMTRDVHYCFADESVEAALDKMGELQVRRLPVLNRDKRLVGIVSIGDLSKSGEGASGEALAQVSEAGGRHAQ
jgi:CBS domain-containing protein